MSFLNLIKERQSCRDFANKEVEKEKLISCIEAARLSPSACNSQPWSFVVVNDKTISKKAAKCTQQFGMNKFTDNCPAFIVVCQEHANISAKLGGLIKSQQYAQIDIGLAVSHICYSATEQGLSTCILGWFDEKGIIELLNLPKKKRVRLVIAIGYAQNDNIRKKVRKDIDDIMTYIG